jgi:hypothetical protein
MVAYSVGVGDIVQVVATVPIVEAGKLWFSPGDIVESILMTGSYTAGAGDSGDYIVYPPCC